MHRIELQTILPTGEYDKTQSINPGANGVGFDPYWAATWFITPNLPSVRAPGKVSIQITTCL